MFSVRGSDHSQSNVLCMKFAAPLLAAEKLPPACSHSAIRYKFRHSYHNLQLSDYLWKNRQRTSFPFGTLMYIKIITLLSHFALHCKLTTLFYRLYFSCKLVTCLATIGHKTWCYPFNTVTEILNRNSWFSRLRAVLNLYEFQVLIVVTVHTAFFWNFKSCNFVNTFYRFRGTCYILVCCTSPFLPEGWYRCAKLHSITSQRTVIL